MKGRGTEERERETLICPLTRDRTHHPGVSVGCSNQPSYLPRLFCVIFNSFNFNVVDLWCPTQSAASEPWHSSPSCWSAGDYRLKATCFSESCAQLSRSPLPRFGPQRACYLQPSPWGHPRPRLQLHFTNVVSHAVHSLINFCSRSSLPVSVNPDETEP